ncbi:hypothetical protein L6164_036976 [Bauhinia variegata]|uniref:Uncharacterized protein n=1 Tax=Bauhinia variegata TaxID=167791 RepID=A0ACB9KIN7_BAUVA|nr:hypothetical protein L6164_036976 [Bauhinia variegata]
MYLCTVLTSMAVVTIAFPLSPKFIVELFKFLYENDGKVEIVLARINHGDLIAVAITFPNFQAYVITVVLRIMFIIEYYEAVRRLRSLGSFIKYQDTVGCFQAGLSRNAIWNMEEFIGLWIHKPAPGAGGKDVFMHCSYINGGGHRSIPIVTKVDYDRVETEDGRVQAVNVKVHHRAVQQYGKVGSATFQSETSKVKFDLEGENEGVFEAVAVE